MRKNSGLLHDREEHEVQRCGRTLDSCTTGKSTSFRGAEELWTLHDREEHEFQRCGRTLDSCTTGKSTRFRGAEELWTPARPGRARVSEVRKNSGLLHDREEHEVQRCGRTLDSCTTGKSTSFRGAEELWTLHDREEHEFQRCGRTLDSCTTGKSTRFRGAEELWTPARPGRARVSEVRKNSGLLHDREGHEFQRCGRTLDSCTTGKSTSFRGAEELWTPARPGRARVSEVRKNSGLLHDREGHEFHSCRNCVLTNRGFQPLRECRVLNNSAQRSARVERAPSPAAFGLDFGFGFGFDFAFAFLERPNPRVPHPNVAEGVQSQPSSCFATLGWDSTSRLP